MMMVTKRTNQGRHEHRRLLLRVLDEGAVGTTAAAVASEAAARLKRRHRGRDPVTLRINGLNSLMDMRAEGLIEGKRSALALTPAGSDYMRSADVETVLIPNAPCTPMTMSRSC